MPRSGKICFRAEVPKPCPSDMFLLGHGLAQTLCVVGGLKLETQITHCELNMGGGEDHLRNSLGILPTWVFHVPPERMPQIDLFIG